MFKSFVMMDGDSVYLVNISQGCKGKSPLILLLSSLLYKLLHKDGLNSAVGRADDQMCGLSTCLSSYSQSFNSLAVMSDSTV